MATSTRLIDVIMMALHALEVVMLTEACCSLTRPDELSHGRSEHFLLGLRLLVWLAATDDHDILLVDADVVNRVSLLFALGFLNQVHAVV